MPHWVDFEKMVVTLRKKQGTPEKPKRIVLTLPEDLPIEYCDAVEGIRQTVHTDLLKILDLSLTPRKLFNQTPAFMGRYFWLEDALAEVEDFERNVSATWNKATGGHSDDSSLLTLFLCVAAGSAPKTLMTEKSATALIRKLRKSGGNDAAADKYIVDHAPEAYQDDYLHLWQAFWEDARPTLVSDMDYQLNDALALLRRECNIAQ